MRLLTVLSVMPCDYFVRYDLCLLHALHAALPITAQTVCYTAYISARKYATSHPETNESMAVLFTGLKVLVDIGDRLKN